MFANLFGGSRKGILDTEGWRRKRNYDEIEKVFESDQEEQDHEEEREPTWTDDVRGARRKAGRMDLIDVWSTLEEPRECEVLGGNEGKKGEKGKEVRSEMVEVVVEAKDMGLGMLGMMTAVEKDTAGARREEEDVEEEPGEDVSEDALLETLLRAVKVAKESRERPAGGVDISIAMEEKEEEGEEKSLDLLGHQTQFFQPTQKEAARRASPVQDLLRGFRGVLGGRRSAPSSAPLPCFRELIEALSTTQADRLEDSARQIAHELRKVQESLRIRLPYQPGALRRASEEQRREMQAQEERRSEGGGVGLEGMEDRGATGGTPRPDEAFEAEMRRGNQLVDQLLALSDATGQLKAYAHEYVNRNEAMLAEKDAWIQTWRAKLETQDTEVRRNKEELHVMDRQVEELVRQQAGAPSGPASPPLSPPSSLALVTSLLDLVRASSGHDMVQARSAQAEQLESMERKRQRVATNLRLVESFVALSRALIEQGKARVSAQVVGIEQEIAEVQAKLQGNLRTEVVGAAARLQQVLEFYETRKERAGKSAKFREHELRQHTSLFGQDTPTETLRLEACVKELRRVVEHSSLAIEQAMHRNQVFWSRVEKALPEPVARALGCVFEQHMTDPRTVNGDASSHSHSTGTLRRAYSPHTPSLSAVAAVAAATTLAGNENPPEGGLPSFMREHSGEREGKTALARVVAEGAAASQQEEEKQAASRERTRRKDGEEEVVMGVTVGGGRRSPEGDGCAVM